jgi:hypothetical protein
MKLGYQFSVTALSLLVFLAGCGTKGITLKIDQSKLKTARYMMGVDISALTKDSNNRSIESSLRTYISGVDSNNSSIIFKVSGSRVQSNFMLDAQKENLEQQFNKVSVVYNPQRGFVSADSGSEVPVVNVYGWDLFKNFTKIFPVFPLKTVQINDVWERELVLPVESAYGDATGHLYQYYKLDSIKLIDNERHLAYISWKYSYNLEITENADTSYLSKMPRNGTGIASAVINLKEGIVESADSDFEVTGDSNPDLRSWRQKVHLEQIM